MKTFAKEEVLWSAVVWQWFPGTVPHCHCLDLKFSGPACLNSTLFFSYHSIHNSSMTDLETLMKAVILPELSSILDAAMSIAS